MNPVLARLIAQRQEQADFIAHLLEQVETESRDLVDAELANLTAARERIAAIDAQLKPLEAFEEIRAAHRTSSVQRDDTNDQPGERRLTINPPKQHDYRNVGEYLCDFAAVHPRQGAPVDPAAEARIAPYLARAVGDNTTADAAGILPTPIVGQILSDMDANRPLISLLGAKSLAGIPGKTFERPKVTGRTAAGDGLQDAELTAGESLEVAIGGVTFTKATFLRWMSVSRQEIDWTSPAAWQTLMEELIAINAEDTEAYAVAKLAAAPGLQTITVGIGDAVSDWITALYAARSQVVTAASTTKPRVRRMPNTIFVSQDMDDKLGTMIDVHLATNYNSFGTASLGSFGGELVKTPRVMLPDLAAGTVIFGRKEGIEYYEERLGLLQTIQPKVLGLDVAYGGYCAAAAVDATLFSSVSL